MTAKPTSLSSEQLTASAAGLAAQLPPLMVEAERVAASASFGVHGRRRAGPGEDFWQFRPYAPGDPTSIIDWRRSAKAGPVYVREQEWQSAQTVALWCDLSPSMAYHSSSALPEKRHRAAVLALALSLLLVDAGERISVLNRSTRSQVLTSRASVRNWAMELEREAGQTDLPVPARPLPAHVHLVVLSDFLMPLSDIQSWIQRLSSARPGGGHLLHVLDPAERDLPFSGRIRFDDVESATDVLIRNTDAIRQSYRDRLHNHCESIREIAAHHGWTFVSHSTDHPAHGPLIGLHRALSGGR